MKRRAAEVEEESPDKRDREQVKERGRYRKAMRSKIMRQGKEKRNGRKRTKEIKVERKCHRSITGRIYSSSPLL